MSQNLEQLTRQAQVLSSIRGIVRTMKTLAAINAPPYEQAAVSIEAFHDAVRAGLQAYAWCAPTQQQNRGINAQSRHILVAFGSDHGFCGNYNELVANQIQDYRTQRDADNLSILCIGAKLQNALYEHRIPILERLTPPASVDGLGRLASEIVTRIQALTAQTGFETATVDLIYTHRIEHAGREPITQALLPLNPSLLQAPQRWPSRSLPKLGLTPPKLLSALLRNHLFASIFQAAAQAMVTENAARLAIMQQAEQSVDERLEAVQREISNQRQDAITQELMDILIGHTPE